MISVPNRQVSKKTSSTATDFDSTQQLKRDPLRFSVSLSELEMGDSEKLMSLKKAYAEIILNTAKEAAARVMVAEKKAFRYQRELADSKEDAVRVMVRLKHMMESRVYEADTRQQSKIDELEAQLHEAEDIVKDLREELAIVRDELRAMRKSRPQRMGEQQVNHIDIRGEEEHGEEIAPPIPDCNHNQISNVQAIHVVTSELENLPDQGISEGVRDDHCETIHISSLDMSPNVTLAKELKLFKKGSFQRIYQVTNEDISTNDGLHGKSHFVKDDSIFREDFENSEKSVSQTSSAEVNYSERKSHSRVKEVKKRNKEFYLAIKIKARNRRMKKSNRPSSLRKRQSLAKKVLKSLQKTNLVTSKTYPFSGETDGPKDIGPPFKTVELCSGTGLHGPIQPCSRSIPENDKSNMCKASTGEENGSAESSVSCADPEIASVPSCSIVEESDELDADDAREPKTDRSIKFTFQRKRKKECMGSADENDIVVVKRSSDGETLVRLTNVESNTNGLFNISSQPSDSKENTLKELKSSLKRMNVDKQEFKTSIKRVDVEMPTDSEPKAIGIVPKATQDRRRLAQVARQLLSISEK